MRGLLIIIFLLLNAAAQGGSADTLAVYPLHKLERTEWLLPYMSIAISNGGQVTAKEIIAKNQFSPSVSIKISDVEDKNGTVFWQKFSLFNDRNSDSVFYLYNKYYSLWSLYELKDHRPVFIAAAGRRADQKQRNDSLYSFVCKIKVPIGDTVEFLIKYPAYFYEYGLGVYLASQRHYNNQFYPEQVKRDKGNLTIMDAIFTGVFIVFSIYSLLLYIQTRKIIYLYYSIFQVLIYLPFALNTYFQLFGETMYTGLFVYISLAQVLSYFFYFLFVECFLRVKMYSPLISKILYSGRVIVVIYAFVITIAYFMISYEFIIYSYNIARGLMLLIGLTAIILSFFRTIPLSGYIAAGSLTLAVCAGFAWLSTTDAYEEWHRIPLMEIGILVELLCFTLGLGAFSKREEEEKIKLQANLISSLQENKLLQERSLKAIVETQESERARIGRDLHDDIGAQLSTLKLFLSSLKSKQGKEHDELLNYSSAILDSSIYDIRNILINLSPKVLDEHGYVKAVEELVNKINSSSLLSFELSMHGMEARLDAKLENSLYRVTQELINNSLKYSWAKKIILDVIRNENKIILMYEDDGRGCEIEKATAGYGLTNIRTRVKMFNGQVYFDSAPGNGFRCEIEIDVSA